MSTPIELLCHRCKDVTSQIILGSAGPLPRGPAPPPRGHAGGADGRQRPTRFPRAASPSCASKEGCSHGDPNEAIARRFKQELNRT
jgi:hypothetical protein